ncbi:InlB B-repeat-containing protein [uncultured Adlercreutzia sp.]|uniref:InlB B-repeat-containing protein n=1 Tax=uncultured Adlercreutzia sp. TaxID=875803 RepID=UPI0025FBC64D|nr:InlB B-repeat-containing protein [uncultured Adlercreutzia sp.]
MAGGGVSLIATAEPAHAAGVDVGANPTPKVDIAVNVPADYPGTFLEFKQELTEKLIAAGMKVSDFRITTTQVAIDTTDTSGWIVYDHYRDQSTYNSLTANLNADQKEKQPYRAADNTKTNGTGTIESYFKNNTNTTGNKCKQFDRHIYSFVDDEGKASMVFAGYGTQALSDYMIYPASSNSRRTFSFDINPAVIDTHTLSSYGFFLNAGVANGNVQGYALIFANNHVGTIQKINTAVNSANITGTSVKTNLNMGIKTGDKVRLSVELNKDTVTIQYQKYDANGNLGPITDLVRDFALDDTGFNGFGPLVNYSKHGCASLSIMKYSDLEMGYEASAFDALKNVQYYEGAEAKYFINLAGDSNDAGIPEESKVSGDDVVVNTSYRDGINRMNENEIFYISNADDGQIVTDSTRNNLGDLTHQGLGSGNGYYATSDNYVDMMAEYIYNNFRDGVRFQPEQVESELPLANFYLKETGVVPERQIMTVHLQHLVNAAKTNESLPEWDRVPDTISVNLYDKSRIGTASGANGTLVKWYLTVTDPDNNTVEGFKRISVTDPADLPDFVFDKNSKPGRYTFTLEVEDSEGNLSRDFSTYITAFLDDEIPFIEGKNTGRNTATISLTDTGQGIDEDGITFIEDGRGSGVAGYWVTNDLNATPSEDDWTMLPFAQHAFDFDVTITSTEPLVVWVRDECDNIGNKAVFQPTYVRVEDADGNPIDDYYVIGEKPIIVLPEDDDVPDPKDPENEAFSGWVTGDNDDPITPGTTPVQPEDNVIIIRPSYSRDYAEINYLVNGGKMDASVTQRVVSGSSILAKIEDHDAEPTRTGYTFTGWKLLNTDDVEKASDATYINTAANVAEVTDQRALAEKNDEGLITRDKYYLVAQWEVSSHTLKLDANGGSLGNVKSIEGVTYDAGIGDLNLPTSGRSIPSKPGYFFAGWSESNDNDIEKIFKAAPGYTAKAEAPAMPDSDKTVYAVWVADTSKFVVSFNSVGGSKITDQAYATATAKNYNSFSKPSRTGYTFAGWYEQLAVDEETGAVTYGDTEFVGGETIANKTNHTFAAKWTPNTNTKYTVQYYVSNGKVNPDGTKGYSLVTEQTKTYEATTESQVTVSSADAKEEIMHDGQRYWLNASSANNVYSGTVTGSPALALKLYYDRYLDVRVDGNPGGTVNSALDVLEGTTPTVSWAPNEGYRVKQVTIDGVIRDDLVGQASYTWPEPIFANHRVVVTFEPIGGSTDDPKTPVNPEKSRFKVNTSVSGCTHDAISLTPSTTVNEGGDHSVTWTPNGYTVKSLVVDGAAVDPNQYLQADGTYKIDFLGLTDNHTVTVEATRLPQNGGSGTEGYSTITVNRYGGDDTCTTSPSATGDEGSTYDATWGAGENFVVYKVVVDGKELTESAIAKGLRAMDFKKNHVVDVYFAPKPTDPEAPVEVPDFNDPEEYVKVTTKIEGYEGTITPSGYVEKTGEDYLIDWSMDLNSGNVDVDGSLDENGEQAGVNDFKNYTVTEVTVNGRQTDDFTVDEKSGQLVLRNLEEDADVVVKVEAEMVDVTTAVIPAGTAKVSKSMTVFKGQNYVNIQSKPETGRRLVEVIVNGELMWNTEPDEPEAADPATAEPETAADAPEATPASVEPQAEPASAAEPEVADAPAAEEPAAEAAATPEVQEVTAGETVADEAVPMSFRSYAGQGTQLIPEVYGPNEAELYYADMEIMTVNDWELGAGLRTHAAEVSVDENGNASLKNIMDDQQVLFVTVGEDETYEGPTENPDGTKESEIVKSYCKVNVSMKDENGNSIVGSTDGSKMTVVEAGQPASTSWTVPAGYSVSQVLVNGEEVSPKDTSWTTDALNGDVTVEVVLKKNGAKTESYQEGDEPRATEKNHYEVRTGLQGGEGSISGAGTYNPKVGAKVTWSVKDPATTKVYQVYVDGVLRPDLVDQDSIEFPPSEAGTVHSVSVVLQTGEEKPVNIDKDADGEPDVDIDTDGDGVPDVNVDTDGDGEPDIDIDIDGDGKPDVNVDVDGDGEPDVNIDTDGDGEPDIDIDTDGDGKPDVNIDTDKDGDPDLFIDYDGDGIPDVNIDTNGDGFPDVNVDHNGDGEPDVNIDTDNTGTWKPSSQGGNADKIWKPDTSIDTGDGQGHVHKDRTTPVDKDGDGVDDRWQPGYIVEMPDGFKYGTMKEDWTHPDGDPAPEGDDTRTGSENGSDGSTGATSENGANGSAGTNGTSGNGSSNGSDEDPWGTLYKRGRLLLAQTGDDMTPILTLMGLIGLGGLVMQGTAAMRRRQEAKAAQQDAE